MAPTVLTASSLAAMTRIRHGFLERGGGVSQGPFASLNMGLRGGDAIGDVVRNRARAAAALGASADRLVTVRQVHGLACCRTRTAWALDALPEADALVTTEPGLLLGVLTADCAPVLLADPAAGVVGAAHAGWRGALAGVLEAVVDGMLEAGAAPAGLVAAVGPCIAQPSYEVGEDFRNAFLAGDQAAQAFFLVEPATGRPHFDLAGYCAWRLTQAGVGRVEMLGVDTAAAPDRFFSHRRSSKLADRRFGLQLSAISLA